MFPLDYVLAVALLTVPAETDLAGPAEGCATLQPALH
jgi:hypothetical protein